LQLLLRLNQFVDQSAAVVNGRRFCRQAATQSPSEGGFLCAAFTDEEGPFGALDVAALGRWHLRRVTFGDWV